MDEGSERASVSATDQFHQRSIVVDGTCPMDWWREHYGSWLAGGVSACVVTAAAWESCREALANIASLLRLVRERDDLVLATETSTIRQASSSDRLAVVIQFQGTHPFEYDHNLAEVYSRLGVRVVQLTYNERSPVGDGCEEPSDAGLSRFGRRLVAELDRTGIVVDVSHTGLRTSLDAVGASSRPVIASHSNAAAVFAHRRNLPDELIRAIAASGGVIGGNGFGPFVGPSPQPGLDEFIDHLAYISELVGTEHVAIGMDYTVTHPAPGRYEQLVAEGHWSPDSYPPPPWRYPAGLDTPSGLPRLTERLFERGFSETDVEGILGANWLRVFEAVWNSG